MPIRRTPLTGRKIRTPGLASKENDAPATPTARCLPFSNHLQFVFHDCRSRIAFISRDGALLLNPGLVDSAKKTIQRLNQRRESIARTPTSAKSVRNVSLCSKKRELRPNIL